MVHCPSIAKINIDVVKSSVVHYRSSVHVLPKVDMLEKVSSHDCNEVFNEI